MDAQSANQRVAAACQGDRAAAVELVEAFYERIYAFLRRLAGNDADAADLTQRTFARVWKALPTFEGKSAVSSWMHGIAYHVYVDWRRVERHGEPRSDEWWSARSTDAVGPDELLARTDLSGVVFAAVDRLAVELRETVHLHYYQELTLQETAEALGVATSTVKYRLRLALTQLQKTLNEQPQLTAKVLSPKAT
jgi:RNA polymerase sigma-70 factor (ECF subfamily)